MVSLQHEIKNTEKRLLMIIDELQVFKINYYGY